MFDDSRSFLTRAFLRSTLGVEYRAWKQADDAILLERLRAWDERLRLSETQAESAFIQTFFVETWGYGESGRVPRDEHTLVPKLRIEGEGAGGGAGEVDLAVGYFRGRLDATPQALCEFKDIRSDLDARQARKGSNRSPVRQCLNYIRGARRGLYGNEPVQPWWGIVTDMNEFRLYWWDRAPDQYARFVIRPPRPDLLTEHDLLSGPEHARAEEARFDRFLFAWMFGRDVLLSDGGRPSLLRLIERQGTRDKQIEGDFYDRYKAVRERLYNVIGPDVGTPTERLRLSQKLLDRFIFAFYCEDMGERMLFPPQMIRDHLKARSSEPFYDESGHELWSFFKDLFGLMSSGGTRGRITIRTINGGLFEPDAAIDALVIPNHVFAKTGQGLNEAALESDDVTLYYLCTRYNYAARGSVEESLSLYTLGRIFEQSIVELEYRQGELENRDTVAKLSKRKRDGVYYTPEWVVNYLVAETLGPWFADARAECGYPADEGGAPSLTAAEAYLRRLSAIRVVDPACGSGAFLISAFRRLLRERIAAAQDVERARGGGVAAAVDESALIADICPRLDDPSLTKGIIVGIQTSADHIYHLQRLGTDRYRCRPPAPPKRPGDKKAPPRPPPYEVEIEDAIMKPLVSGEEAKRYEDPKTSTYLLFPYERDAHGAMRLIPAAEMEERFEKAWKHLTKWDNELRGRENKSFDDDKWYRFGRNQNLDKQDVAKLIVAQTVPEMRVCADFEASGYLNNVRVNGILSVVETDLAFILGVLNGPVADFVFRCRGKPKQGGYFEANKQFIEYLPVPKATPDERREVADRARRLQKRWTLRRDLLDAAAERVKALARARHPTRWLWPDLPDLDSMVESAPRSLTFPPDRREWAAKRLLEQEASRLETFGAALARGGRPEPSFADGALRLSMGGAAVLGPIFLGEDEGRLAEAYWRWLLEAGGQRNAEKLSEALRKPPRASTSAAATQFIERVDTLISEVAAIRIEEEEMNELLYRLYRLTPDEKELVENDRGRRGASASAG